MKQLLLIIGLSASLTAFAQDTNSVSTNSALVNIGTGLLQIGESIYNAAPTNFAVAPYGTYVVNAKKWGYGLLAAWNVNQNLGVVAGVDHVDTFLAFNGGLQLKLPVKVFGVTATPFAITAIGMPFAGAGADNGGVQTILSAGAAVDVAKFWGGTLSVVGAYGSRGGAGAYGGGYANAALAWRKGF